MSVKMSDASKFSHRYYVELPCRCGTPLYFLTDSGIKKSTTWHYEISEDDISIVDDKKDLRLRNNCGYYTFDVNVFLIEQEAQEIIDEEDLNG